MALTKKDFVRVISKRGKHLLQLVDGTHIPAIMWTRVYDGGHNEQSYVIAKILVQIKDTEND